MMKIQVCLVTSSLFLHFYQNWPRSVIYSVMSVMQYSVFPPFLYSISFALLSKCKKPGDEAIGSQQGFKILFLFTGNCATLRWNSLFFFFFNSAR